MIWVHLHGNQFSDIGIFRWLSLSKPSASLAFSCGRSMLRQAQQPQAQYLKNRLKTIRSGYLIPKLVVEKYRADEN